MTFQKRRQLILQALDETGEADIHRLALELETSEITIRRDLNRLAEEGMLSRTHGGAMKIDPLINVKAFEHKTAVNAKTKDAICRRAAAEINDGDIIFMDCGSTVFRLCPFIRNKRIKVITNSLPVIYELRESAVTLNMIGGEVDRDRQAIHGKIAEEHIARYKATKAFLGVDGISLNGLFAHSEKEASITLAFAGQSKHTYMLCDAGKIGKEMYLHFSDLTLVQTLITDFAGRELDRYRSKGLTVLTVNV